MTFSHFAAAPDGREVRAWAHRGGRWTPVGRVELAADGSGMLIVEGPEVAVPPDALEVTLEPAGAVGEPAGDLIVRWTGP
jgi:hypothetical protein